MASRTQSYRDLEVWQRAIDLVTEVYQLSKGFPADERFGLTSQLRRAASSIPANIAEGSGRAAPGELHHSVSIARGSCAEVDTILEIAERLQFIAAGDLAKSRTQLEKVSRMLAGLKRYAASASRRLTKRK